MKAATSAGALPIDQRPVLRPVETGERRVFQVISTAVFLRYDVFDLELCQRRFGLGEVAVLTAVGRPRTHLGPARLIHQEASNRRALACSVATK
jgi:hypothetical protein